MMLPRMASLRAGQFCKRGVFDLAAGQAAALRRANPVEDFPAPPFHVAERNLVGGRRRHVHPRRSLGQRGDKLLDNRERLLHFVDAHLHPPQHIALADRPAQ